MQNDQIAERIKTLCSTHKISIKSLLSECDINRNTIYDIEKRNVSPSSDKIIKIADYFNVSTDYLLGRSDIPDNPNLKINNTKCLI